MATVNELIGKVITKKIIEEKLEQERLSSEGVVDVAKDIVVDVLKFIPGYSYISSAWNMAEKTKNKVDAVANPASLTEFTKTANHHPRVLIEENLRELSIMPRTVMALVNMYAAYYLQAVALTANVKGVSVLKQLDRFNPNRSNEIPENILDSMGISSEGLTDNYFHASTEAMLNIGYKLPSYRKPLSPEAHLYALEAEAEQNSQVKPTAPAGKSVEKAPETKADNAMPVNANDKEKIRDKLGLDKNNVSAAMKQINDLNNLSVGRLLSVAVTIDGSTINVPMAIRMMPMTVPRLIMRELVAFGDVRQSASERWHRFRSGEINFTEWLFMTDVIKNRRKLLTMDKNGVYREILKRRVNAKKAALATERPSIGMASSFIIVSKATVEDVRYRMGVTVDDPAFLKRMFEESAAMILLVVDTEWERIDMYTRGIEGKSQFTFKDFEGLGKGDGVSVQDVMKAYLAGNAPRF